MFVNYHSYDTAAFTGKIKVETIIAAKDVEKTVKPHVWNLIIYWNTKLWKIKDCCFFFVGFCLKTVYLCLQILDKIKCYQKTPNEKKMRKGL